MSQLKIMHQFYSSTFSSHSWSLINLLQFGRREKREWQRSAKMQSVLEASTNHLFSKQFTLLLFDIQLTLYFHDSEFWFSATEIKKTRNCCSEMMLSPTFAARWIGLLLHLGIDIWSWMGHFGVSWEAKFTAFTSKRFPLLRPRSSLSRWAL